MGLHDRDYLRDSAIPSFRRSTMVRWLLLANVAVFVLDSILGGSLRGNWIAPYQWGHFSPAKAIGGLQVWRFVTYSFLHADLLHIFFNLLWLYFLGPLMEDRLGRRRFLALYLLGAASGAVLFSLFALFPGFLRVGWSSPMIGASAAVYALSAGALVAYPTLRVHLWLPPVELALRTLILILLGIAALSVLVGSRNAGGEAAHLGGAVAGYLLLRFPRLLDAFEGGWRVRRRPATPRHDSAPGKPSRAEIDRVLDKINAHGIHSLTRAERRILDAARDDLR